MDCERFELLLSVSTEGFWDWDLKKDLAYLSPRYCELIGYSPDETPFDSAFLLAITPPDDSERISGTLKELFEGKPGISTFEQRFISKDGAVRWYQVRAKGLEFDDQGRPARLVGTIVDINDRKHAEDELRHSHTLLNNLSMQVPGALFQTLISPDGHICTPYSSEKLHDVYEVSPDQIRSDINAIAQRFHPDDRDRIFASISAATESLTKWECEYRVILPRQGLKWLYGIALPQRQEDGTVDLYGIIMDVTERRRIEESLSHSRQLLSSVLENAPSAFFVKEVQSDFRVVLWNRAAEKIFGIPAAAMLGRNTHDFWEWERAESYLDNDRVVVASRTPLDIPEIASSHPEKGTIYLHIRKIPLFDGNGAVTHIVVICDDITEHRMMLAELVKNQKLESLGVLAGGIAHDFNNILTGIVGNISFARSTIDESHKATAILQKAEKAANRAADLANQLLTFAKGSQPVKKVASVRRILEESASLVLRGSSVAYRIETPGGLPDVEVDEGQIAQVLNNIIINASQAMPGGGTISIRGDELTAEASSPLPLQPGRYVRIAITDTGCGISEEDQKRIFDPYFTTKAGGSGLGLASAHSIVAKHGGHIIVRSLPNEGTTFEILLPACDGNADHSASGTTPVPLGVKNNFSVLVMDDEEIIREMACFMLEELGYHVHACANGDEAVALYTAAWSSGKPYSAVIMDLTIPGGMGGKEAAQRILSSDPNAALIVSSGYSTDPIMAEYADYGFRATLQKPYAIEDVTMVLTAVLSPGQKQ